MYRPDTTTKRIAQHLRRIADVLDGASAADLEAVELDLARVAVRPLAGTALAAANYIRANPGAEGKQIADAIGCSFEHFRRSIVPKLKRHAFYCVPGDGYHPPM